MSDPHRLRSQSLVISSDKTLAARAALRIWVELMKRKRGPRLGLHSIVLHDHAAGAATMRVSENPTIWRSADASRTACARFGVPDG